VHIATANLALLLLYKLSPHNIITTMSPTADDSVQRASILRYYMSRSSGGSAKP
jgi:hypothetical protein